MTSTSPGGFRMRTRDLPQPVAPHRVSIESVGPEQTAESVEPGDFLLSRAHGVKHTMIKWGQGLRITAPEHRPYRGYTHAALVVSAEGDLIEAVGAGVREATLKDYLSEFYQVVHIEAAEMDRRQVVAVAKAALGRKSGYNLLATVNIALWAFTGSRLVFFTDGAYTCSGLVARSLLAAGAVFAHDEARVTPAQLAIYFQAPPPPPEPPRPRRWWPWAVLRRAQR